ncbi:MAG: PorP/SprF family type IX secretion system membrane protein [Chitinophagaceae bacterium]
MKKISVTFLLMLSAFWLQAQDINFSQFYELPALRNPALAGIYKGDLRMTGVFRSQWQQATGQFQTTGLSVESKSGVNEWTEDFYAVALQVTNDVGGDGKLGRTQVLPSFTYHKLLREESNLYLSAGFSGGLVQQRFDPSKLSFDDQFVNGSYSRSNPTRQSFNSTNVTYFDASAGIAIGGDLGYKYKFYLGASYAHFNRPKVAFNKNNDVRLNQKIAINAGLSCMVSDYDQLFFYGDYFFQGSNNLLQGGFLYKHNLLEEAEDPSYVISFGTFYRWNDALIPVVKLDYMKVSVGITYDVNISKLKAATQFRGGAEVTLSYKTFLNTKRTSANKMRCPIL